MNSKLYIVYTRYRYIFLNFEFKFYKYNIMYNEGGIWMGYEKIQKVMETIYFFFKYIIRVTYYNSLSNRALQFKNHIFVITL